MKISKKWKAGMISSDRIWILKLFDFIWNRQLDKEEEIFKDNIDIII